MTLKKILTEPEHIQAYCLRRFDVSVSDSHAKQIANRWNGEYWDRHKDDATSCFPVIWLDNRLQEFGYWNTPHVDPSEIRLTVDLHFWRMEIEREFSLDDHLEFMRREFLSGVKRSPLSRIAELPPINAAARRVSGWVDMSCRFCNRRFRNGAAMVLHVAESHSDAMR